MATAETPKAFKIANVSAIPEWGKQDIKDAFLYISELEKDTNDATHKDWSPLLSLSELLDRPWENTSVQGFTEFSQHYEYHQRLRKQSSFYDYFYRYVKEAIGWTGKKGILSKDNVEEYIRECQGRRDRSRRVYLPCRGEVVLPPSDSEDDIGTDDDIAPIEDI